MLSASSAGRATTPVIIRKILRLRLRIRKNYWVSSDSLVDTVNLVDNVDAACVMLTAKNVMASAFWTGRATALMVLTI